jgi:oligopeptide transport system ATP-binding protein
MALIEVTNLSKTFRQAHPGLSGTPLPAVDRVSFSIDAGDVFGLVGESGCGKTTVGRCLLRLIEPSSGHFSFRGESVFEATPDRLLALRREMQMVFQDPSSALDPRMCAEAIVSEGLEIHGIGAPTERRARVIELLEMVGLDPAMRSRMPREFSGGQRQRIGIARALALRPSFLIADEPVSALDVSVQAQVVNVFAELQQKLGLTLLFVAHDLRLVRHLCRRVAVMYRGRLVEMGPTGEVFSHPAHDYTRALLSAMPHVGLHRTHTRVTFDPRDFNAYAPLLEVAPGHWVA